MNRQHAVATARRVLPNGVAAAVTPARRRAIRDGALLAGLIFNFVLIFMWGSHLLLWGDAQSWYTIDLGDLYGRAERSLLEVGAFRLAPAFAWLMYPLTLVPYPVFIAIYLALSLGAIVVLLGRWTPVALIAFPPVLLELLNGNIHIFLALAIWAGLRWPGAWAVPLLTKVTPGVGVVWFAARGEWRNLATALIVTGAIVVAGFAIAPSLWLEWFRSLAISTGLPPVGDLPPLLIRLPVAAAVVWFAGRTDRAWLVPLACVLAMPTIWLQSSAIALASFPLWWQRARWQRPKVRP